MVWAAERTDVPEAAGSEARLLMRRAAWVGDGAGEAQTTEAKAKIAVAVWVFIFEFSSRGYVKIRRERRKETVAKGVGRELKRIVDDQINECRMLFSLE